MTTIVVLFNLKPGTDVAAYEDWAKTVDLPTVKRLPGCSDFEVLRTTGMLNGDPSTPYSHVELIRVADMESFRAAVGTPEMQVVAAQFQAFAQDPLFMVSESLE